MMSTDYRPNGKFHDQLTTGQGKLIDLDWRSNLVVDRCRFLIAGFMRGDGPSGIQRLQIGRGLDTWDTEPPDPPDSADQQLADPAPFVVAIVPSQIVYLDDLGMPVTGPTNRIEISVDLAAGEPPLDPGETAFPLREFGLFGDFGGEDFMINYVRHPVIHKQADDTLTRTIRLVF